MIIIKFKHDDFYGKCCEVNYEVKYTGNYKDVCKEIGCEFFDVVDIGHGIDMWVDDEGMMKEKLLPNWIATALRTISWCKSGGEISIPCNYPPIFGKVALLGHDEDGNTVDLTEEQVKYIESLIK